MQQYSEGKDISLDPALLPKKLDLPYQIIKWGTYGMSVIKILPNMTKNKRGK
jgi:hypothetical protein